MKFGMRLGCGLMMTLALLQLHAQPRIAKGAGIPSKSLHCDWYLDTLDGGLWQRDHRVWVESIESPADDLFGCGNLAIIHTSLGYRAIGEEADWISPPYDEVRCLDSLLLLEDGSSIKFIHTADGRWLGGNPWGYLCWEVSPVPDTIAGVLAYCVVPLTMEIAVTCDELRTWGMIGFNGKWLIQPIYDLPFHFQNGIAEVIYYGQKRKINAEGAFVE